MATLVNRSTVSCVDNFSLNNIRWNKYCSDILMVNIIEKEGLRRIILKLV